MQEQQRSFGGAPVLGEVGEDPGLFLAAEGRVGEDDVHAFGLADLVQAKAQGVARVDLGRVHPVQKQVQLRQQEGQ